MLLFLFKISKNKMKGNFLKCSFTAGSGLRFFCLSRSDWLTSTNSFIKRLVVNFVNVNKIRVCISILQKHAF